MKCLIYYFTGSGHTRIAAQDLKKHLEEEGIATDLYESKYPNDKFPDPTPYDLIGFGYPIHAFNLPKDFINLIKKKLPVSNVKDKKAFIFKVSGEPFHPNDASSYRLVRDLRKKGYKPVLEKHLLMPYDIMFRYPDNLAKQMYLYLDPLTKVLAIKIKNGEEMKLKYRAIHHVNSFLFRIEYIAGPVNHPFVRINKKKCVNCLACVHNCPNGACYVNKKGKIKVDSKCNICMRCTYFCPQNAIHFGFMNPFKVNKPYPFNALAQNVDLKGDYVNKNTKGYFKHFRKYFKAQNELLKQYGIPLPVTYGENDLL